MNNRFICMFNDYENVGLPRLNVVSNVPHSCVNVQRISFSASLLNHNVNQDKFFTFLIYFFISFIYLFISLRCCLLFYAHVA